MVQRFIDFQGDKCDKRKTKKFRVFGLDFDEFEWIEKNTLGGIALFWVITLQQQCWPPKFQDVNRIAYTSTMIMIL